MDSSDPWLTDAEQAVWRRWLRVGALLPAALQRSMQADSSLSLPDFEVLVHLTESSAGRIRVTDLANALHWERSRVSHHVTRMERRGLVAREGCTADGRGAYVLPTAAGRDAIATAAPEHAREVRRLMFDHLSAGELEALGDVLDKVLSRFDDYPRN